MKAIFKREIKAYFSSAIGYIFIGISLLLSGFFFGTLNLLQGTSYMGNFFSNLITVFMFLIPILTMRLFSEERKTKTDQILITSPVSITEIVLGKFFAASCMLLISLSVTIIYALIVALLGKLAVGEFVSMFLGIFLLNSALIAIGIFMSSLTENQVVAAISTFGVFLLLYVIDLVSGAFTSSFAIKIIGFLSVFTRMTDFYMGLLNVPTLLYYISICVVFIFLTIRVIEKRRWS